MTKSTWTRVRQFSAAVAMATAALSCSREVATHAIQPQLLTRVTSRSDPDAELSLDRSCAVRSLETCFNALDDDCNGLVDEGCGLPNGALQIVVAWAEPEVDVDLVVSDPNGERVQPGQYTALGLTKDRDCPGEQDDCGGQNFEVATSGPQLPRGTYRVELVLDRPPSDQTDVSIVIGGHWGAQQIRGKFVLSGNKPKSSVEFLSEYAHLPPRQGKR